MDSVHFRLPHNITQIMDTAAHLGIFDSRSGGLRTAATYAILDGTSAQAVYDNLILFNDLVQEFKNDASHLIQESLAGNTEPLQNYATRVESLIMTFPTFWQEHLYATLQTIPEYRVVEQCLEMAKEND